MKHSLERMAKYKILKYPSLFLGMTEEISLLNYYSYLFFTIGNGYEWQNNILVDHDPYESDIEYVEIPKLFFEKEIMYCRKNNFPEDFKFIEDGFFENIVCKFPEKLLYEDDKRWIVEYSEKMGDFISGIHKINKRKRIRKPYEVCKYSRIYGVLENDVSLEYLAIAYTTCKESYKWYDRPFEALDSDEREWFMRGGYAISEIYNEEGKKQKEKLSEIIEKIENKMGQMTLQANSQK